MRKKKAGFNYSQIARETGLSVSFISRVMRGERRPSLKSFMKIKKVMSWMNTDEALKLVGMK